MSVADLFYRGAQPKPEPRSRTKARKRREDAEQLQAFRSAVWARERIEGAPGHGACQQCARVVSPTGPGDYRGEVHHVKSRRHKATRYDPANGQLLCVPCHRAMTEHRA